jgi:GNAT superfamily N-acetyltransferase
MENKLTMRPAGPDEAPLLARLNRELAEDVDYRRPLPEPEFYLDRMHKLLAEGYKAALFYLDESESGQPPETCKPTHSLADSPMGGPSGVSPEVAAYALFIDRGDEIYLRMFYVRRDSRRRGVGREAMRMLIASWPRDRVLTVDTFANNAPALAFWHAVGYRDYQVVLRMEAGER